MTPSSFNCRRFRKIECAYLLMLTEMEGERELEKGEKRREVQVGAEVGAEIGGMSRVLIKVIAIGLLYRIYF